MRILTLTTLYPNAAAPAHGVFVENRLAAFAARHGADIRVIAPVPWFPIAAGWAGAYARYARAPRDETRRGLHVSHPRYAIPPKVGMTYAAHALERCFYREARKILDGGWEFDVIDAHYLYPDGIAAVRAAKRLGKPVIVTARGADVNLLPKFPRQRRMILEAVRDADAAISVCQALKDELARLGAPGRKIHVLRNGVDLSLFRPLDRDAARARLGLEGTVIASVGLLIERKGHHLLIEALAKLPDATLAIVGEGKERGALERLARRLGVERRVKFVGAVAHAELAAIYNAADLLALASSREGWPNVLLEAMACGAQVVATPVWGSREVVRDRAAGRLAAARTPSALAEAIGEALDDPPARPETRAYAEGFSWDETSDGLNDLFTSVLAGAGAKRAVSFRPVKTARKDRAPRLIVTIDTEEQFDWSRFDREDQKIADPADIDRFQSLAARFGVKPLYLLTHPMIADDRSRDYFASLVAAGAADLGLHLHQWVTPPYTDYSGQYYSFECNLPRNIYLAKLRSLADSFETAFGFRARAYRAGRYGISTSCYPALGEIGVEFDFSPSVGFDASASGGPDFSEMSNAPFAARLPSGKEICVTPICGARALKGVKVFLPQGAGLAGLNAARRRSLVETFAWPLRLTCEGRNFRDLKSLTRRLAAAETPVMTFSLHSTSLTAGATPYSRDEAAVAARLALCADYFGFFRDQLGGRFLSLDDLAADYSEQA